MRATVALLLVGGCETVFPLVPPDAPPSPYASAVMADQPVAYWRLGDSTGTAKDETGNGNVGVYTGGVTHIAGAIADEPDLAAVFDGKSGFVDIGNRLGFEGTAAFSLEAWVNPTTQNGFNGVITKERDPAIDGHHFGYLIEAETGVLQFQRSEDPASQLIQTSPLQIGKWTHVVATFDGIDVRLYVDGDLKTTSTAPTVTLTPNDKPFVIGARNGGTIEFFDGAIDEVAVYDRELTLDQINQHRTVGLGQ